MNGFILNIDIRLALFVCVLMTSSVFYFGENRFFPPFLMNFCPVKFRLHCLLMSAACSEVVFQDRNVAEINLFL